MLRKHTQNTDLRGTLMHELHNPVSVQRQRRRVVSLATASTLRYYLLAAVTELHPRHKAELYAGAPAARRVWVTCLHAIQAGPG